MRSPCPAALFLLAVMIGPGSPRAQEPAPAKPAPTVVDAKSELDKLQGTWHCVSWIFDGARVPEKEQGVESVYDGNRITLKRQGVEYRHGLVTLDPARTPKAINTWDQDGPLADQTNRGIYEVKDDTLKVCIALDPENARPTEFASVPGSNTLLLTYKRQRP